MSTALASFLTKTPFYPLWLDIRNEERGTTLLVSLLQGKVLETGAGNCVKKERALALNPRIRKYIATDYSSWDELFAKQAKAITALGSITQAVLGAKKDNSKIDVVCDAMDLPFRNESFDAYCSYEVLEHIPDPLRFFQEANRVLKVGGLCLTTMPFLYREHGGMEWDYQRFARGGYRQLAEKTGFEVKHVFSYCCFGTTLASMTNQYVIRKIMEGSWFIKALLLPISPFIFFTMNSIGFCIDTIDQDIRFAERFHVVMRKRKNLTSQA